MNEKSNKKGWYIMKKFISYLVSGLLLTTTGLLMENVLKVEVYAYYGMVFYGMGFVSALFIHLD